ncbi:MAG: secretin and TonB N-terminal domain-containing protein [Candidatus Omnitrophica bacterium]|nr:secretin and TonB N-terminal domain-containing protein [Candidatus Omnitrophota bacterium]
MNGSLQSLRTLTVALLTFFAITTAAQRGFAQNEEGGFGISTLSAEALVPEGSESPSEEARVTVDFKDADILNVLRILSLKSGVNIVTGPEVRGTITVRLTDVPWDRALDIVLRTYGYVYERSGNVIRVTTRENLAAEELVTETFILNYTTAQEVEEAIKEMLTERGRIKSVPRANVVIVTDVATNLYKIAKVIRTLDKRTPQVYIDSKVVRTALRDTENLGIDWNIAGGLGTGSVRPTTLPFTADKNVQFPFPFGRFQESFFPQLASGTTDIRNERDVRAFPQPAASASSDAFTFGTLDFSSLSAVLNLLRSRTNTKIISNPRIVVLNNQTAKVQVGQEIGLPTFERNETSGSFEVTGFTPRDVGVVLSVTPHVNNADEILVDLKPEVSSFDGFTAIGTTNLAFPSFTTTEAATQVLIKDNETIAIGGLLTDAKSTTDDAIPFLSEIPVLGKIFRSKRETAGSSNEKIETLFFVTVNVVDTEGQPMAGLQPAQQTPTI